MANASSASNTAYANLDWDHYNRYRPSYPPSLKELVYGYHNRHHRRSSWERLVDIGGGVGISSVPYIADFDAVHLLDPSALNCGKARTFLTEHISKNCLQTKLEVTVAKAEDGFEHIKDASLAICATAAHFIDSSQLGKSLFHMLQAQGTIAIYSYWNPIFPEQSPALTIEFAKAGIKALRFCLRPGDEHTTSIFTDAAARLCAGTGVLDAIPMPHELFEDVQRIRINPAAEVAMQSYHEDPPVPCIPLASQVGTHEERIDYVTGQHAEASGWSFLAGLDWLHGMISTVLPSDMELSDEQSESLFGNLDSVFAAECPTGSARILFGLNMILATRRG